jgi:hypothetical protein
MNRFKMIFNLLLGKELVIYDSWHREVLMIIGGNEEIIAKRFDYDWVFPEEECLYGDEETGKIYYEEREY